MRQLIEASSTLCASSQPCCQRQHQVVEHNGPDAGSGFVISNVLVLYATCGVDFISFKASDCVAGSDYLYIYNDMFHLYKTAQSESVHIYNVEYSPLSIPGLAGVNEVNEVKEEAGLEEVDDPVNNKVTTIGIGKFYQ